MPYATRGDLRAQERKLGAALARADAGPSAQVRVLVSFLRQKRDEAARNVLGTAPHQLVAYLADLTDLAVRAIHDLAVGEVQGEVPTPSPIALVATGGYGRRQLCPFSDVDIALVTGHPSDATGGPTDSDCDQLLKVSHRLIVEVLQDGLGLEVGYAYRPVAACAELDHPTQTALLDARFVAGDEALFTSLRSALLDSLDPLAYMQAKMDEKCARRAKFGDTPYYLEPDVKNSAGGLRDVQTLRWLAAARFGVQVPAALEELERRGFIARQEREALHEAEGFLLQVRCWLHFTKQSRLDVLVRSLPRTLADGYAQAGRASLASGKAVMAHYYGCAATILATCERAARECLESEMDLQGGLLAARGELRASRPGLFEEDPAALIRAFCLAQRYQLRMASALRELIRASLPLADAHLRWSPRAAQHFRAILSAPARVEQTLRDMWGVGLLPRYLPEIAGLEQLVPSDRTHELTVGAHTLRTISNLEGIPTLAGDAYEQLRDAYADVGHRDLLVLACLLHDAGKSEPARDHCEAGSRLAAKAARRLGLSPAEAQVVTDLVRKHLFLVRTARLQDITLTSTVATFAHQIGSVDLLNMLYVLSYADTAAVGPGVLTDINRQQADDLYFRTLRYLVSGMDDLEMEGHVRRIREEAERRLRASGKLGDAAISRHLRGMPSSYLLSNHIGAIAEHISFAERVPTERLVVNFYNEQGKQFTELTVCCRDDPGPGLFAKIAGTLYANDVSIHTAQIYTRQRDDIALDILWVDYEGRQIPEAKQATARRDLTDVLTRGASVPDLLAAKSRSAPQALMDLSLHATNTLDEDHSVVQLVAADQPGLLYRATQAMASVGLDIHSARITTWRGQAEDAFYVKWPDGRKLNDEEAAAVERQLTDLLARR